MIFLRKEYNIVVRDSEAWYIGVDGGGTKTHAILVDHSLNQVDEVYSGPANIATDVEGAYKSICNAIDYLLSKHKYQVKHIGIGVAGYSVIQNRSILKNKLQRKYTNIILNSDCHIACLAAHHNQNGTIIVCGTGVVAYSISNGKTKQIGGWGFPHGDLGGGAYLGLEVARLLCKAIDELIPWHSTLVELYADFFEKDKYKYKMWLIGAKPVDYARIAKFVLLRPIDELSNKILECGANEISMLIIKLKLDTPRLPIKLVGGLAKLYINLLQAKCPWLELSTSSPSFGAALLGPTQVFI
ncbi:MAG: gspK [Burkholderiales bacterium]|jgi:glucosamine kinase|nr:gspK [Burkholderiales bacterium]